MRKNIVIKGIEQLEKGMEVEFKHSCLSNTYKAVVSDVEYKQTYRMIDDKPVRALSVQSVNLKCLDGNILTVRESNFQDFHIRRIK